MTNSNEQERIWAEPGDEDAWHCLCGNQPCDGGFYPCDEEGNEIEPVIGSDWTSLYVCWDCGRIIDADSLIVVGRTKVPPIEQEAA